MGKHLFAISSKEYIQYPPVDASPTGSKFSVYLLEQKGKPFEFGFTDQSPLQFANEGRPLFVVENARDGSSFEIVHDGKMNSLREMNSLNEDISDGLAVTSQHYCCTAAGSSQFYRLSNGEELFVKGWNDSGFNSTDTMLVADQADRWILLTAKAYTPKETDKTLTIQFTAFQQNTKQEHKIAITLPNTWKEICGDHCGLEMFVSNSTRPDKPDDLPRISTEANRGTIRIIHEDPTNQAQLVLFTLSADGTILSIACPQGITCKDYPTDPKIKWR